MNLEELIKEQIGAEGPTFDTAAERVEYVDGTIAYMHPDELLKRISDTLEEAGILPFRGRIRHE